MKKFIVALVLSFSMAAHADDCWDRLEACLIDANSCMELRGKKVCFKYAKSCVLRVDSCPDAVKRRFLAILDCGERGNSFDKCAKAY